MLKVVVNLVESTQPGAEAEIWLGLKYNCSRTQSNKCKKLDLLQPTNKIRRYEKLLSWKVTQLNGIPIIDHGNTIVWKQKCFIFIFGNK